ncbi:MAG: hypothetical protein AB7U35_01830 [Sphingobium sp.]
MRLQLTDIAARVGEMVKAAGIDNFHMENNLLIMCGVSYHVEACECSDPECNGLRLRRAGDQGMPGFGAVQ